MMLVNIDPVVPAKDFMPEIKKVGVLGCGLMGSGIAQTAAAAGFQTVVRDVAEPLLEKGRGGIQKSLGRLVEKGKLPAADRDEALARLSFATDLGALCDCDIIIEAVTEDLELKNRLWRELDGLCPPRTIFASNTSSLTIAAMAATTRRTDRFVGLHFFNPVPLMPLVEVVRTATTSQDTFDRAYAFARQLGKEPVAATDSPGFIVNLLLVPYLLDAARALERRVASTSDLDRAMQLGCGHPMGPLTLLDYIGLDTVVRISEIMFDSYREPRYAAPPLLQRMVVAGFYGRKSGRGFYDYSVEPPAPLPVGSLESGVRGPKGSSS
jgi:3-hydroxybutyryl-CoA dehydrogenase